MTTIQTTGTAIRHSKGAGRCLIPAGGFSSGGSGEPKHRNFMDQPAGEPAAFAGWDACACELTNAC